MRIILSETNQYHCSQCGNEITRSPSNVRSEHLFCNRSCSATFYNKSKIIVKPCLGCNQLFHPKKGNKGKFCSHKCKWDFNRIDIYRKIEEGTYKSATNAILRKYLIEKHGEKCILCGWDKLHPITGRCPVQVDHIDGNTENCKADNIRLICPCCHSLTPTYMNLNKGRGNRLRRERYLKGVKSTKTYC